MRDRENVLTDLARLPFRSRRIAPTANQPISGMQTASLQSVGLMTKGMRRIIRRLSNLSVLVHGTALAESK